MSFSSLYAVAPDGSVVYESVETGKRVKMPRERVMEQGYVASSPETTSTQQRLDKAMKTVVEGAGQGMDVGKIVEEQLFIGNDERPPEVLNHPKFGPVRLSSEEENAYIYTTEDGSQEIVIRKK